MEKRLYRSKREKMIAGVAGGIAAYFDVDPVLVRVAFIVLLLIHGIGFLAYIILWIVVPFERVEAAVAGAGDAAAQAEGPIGDVALQTPVQDEKRKNRSVIGGAFLIALGVLFLMENLIPGFDFSDYWPVLLIGLGAGLLWNTYNSR